MKTVDTKFLYELLQAPGLLLHAVIPVRIADIIAGVRSKNKSELEIAIDERKNLLIARTMEEFDNLLDFITHKKIPSPTFMKKALLKVQQRNFDFLDKIFWKLADEATGVGLTDRLGEISMPTLVIWGRHDRVLDVSCTEAMAASIPNNKVGIDISSHTRRFHRRHS